MVRVDDLKNPSRQRNNNNNNKTYPWTLSCPHRRRCRPRIRTRRWSSRFSVPPFPSLCEEYICNSSLAKSFFKNNFAILFSLFSKERKKKKREKKIIGFFWLIISSFFFPSRKKERKKKKGRKKLASTNGRRR